MVSEKREGPSNRNLQRGDQHRRNRYATHRTVDCRTSWLALGILVNRRVRLCLAHSLAMALSNSRTASLLHQRRKKVYSKRPCRTGWQNQMEPASASPANVGVCRREIHD